MKISLVPALAILLIQGHAHAAEPAAVASDDPQMWVQRMNRALMGLNYEGTFFHLRHGKVETLSIVHRVQDRKVTERLVSLDGNGREIIRREGEQLCFIPDQRRVLVQTIDKPGGLLGAPTFCRNVEINYALEMKEPQKLSGRMTRVIAVNPRDHFRYGYRLWLDEQTALPIKTQLLDSDGNVIEQILFAKLTLPERIPESAVQPGVNSEGFKWVRAAPPPAGGQQQPGWQAEQLPPGFRLVSVHNRRVNTGAPPRMHLVYSDGLATVSVFVEGPDTRKPMKGPSRIGSSYMFFRVVQDHQITAIGDVPMKTVRLIAGSVKPDTPAVAGQR